MNVTLRFSKEDQDKLGYENSTIIDSFDSIFAKRYEDHTYTSMRLKTGIEKHYNLPDGTLREYRIKPGQGMLWVIPSK